MLVADTQQLITVINRWLSGWVRTASDNQSLGIEESAFLIQVRAMADIKRRVNFEM